jgi:DNA-binding phage protein
MAEELGLSFSAYYHWLEGRSSPRLSQLLKVMDGLGLSLVVHGGKRDAA